MKFHYLQTYKHFDNFKLEDSRNFLDLLVIQRLICLLDVKNILEIGYYEGLTFGVMCESSSSNATLTSCDITYENDVFRKFYNIEKNCNFYNCKSVDLIVTNPYDFIVIDGDHSYTNVSKELELLDQWATDDCVIVVDDYHLPGVKKALDVFIPKSNFSPVLIGPQQVFLIRKENERFIGIVDHLRQLLLCVSAWKTVEWHGWHLYQYQYIHEVYVNVLKDIIKYLDL